MRLEQKVEKTFLSRIKKSLFKKVVVCGLSSALMLGCGDDSKVTNNYNTTPSVTENCAQNNMNIYYKDYDKDGAGSSLYNKLSCSLPEGYVANNLDCDDSNANINPDAIEILNGIDDNCDRQIDETFPKNNYYKDYDGDGAGTPFYNIWAYSPPNGYVANNLDCDDTNANINPDAIEVCNGIDDNCNGQIDENLPKKIYCKDYDKDGFGNPSNNILYCSPPKGYVDDCSDSDDTNVNVPVPQN